MNSLDTYVKSGDEVTPRPYREEQMKKRAREWDGKDFKGDKCLPSVIAYMKEHPKIFDFLRLRPQGSIDSAVSCIKLFTNYATITPEKWLTLPKKQARDLLWDFVREFSLKHTAKALNIKNNLSRFYAFHVEEQLPWIKTKHTIKREPVKIKERMTKEKVWRIIQHASNIRDEAIFSVAFQAGIRKNVLTHLTYGHYKNFLWFKKEGSQITNSDEEHGNIAIFKVIAKPHEDYVHDNKIIGKEIHWFYACLHIEATKALKRYVAKYLIDAKHKSPLFYASSKEKPMNPRTIFDNFKRATKRAGLPYEKIPFHALRRAFRSVVRNTSAITDNEFKESIMGHKLRGSQEAYFDKDPLEFATEYAKCDFSPTTEIQKKLEQRVKELEQKLDKQKKDTNNKLTKQQETIKEILRLIGQLGQDGNEEINEWLKEYQENANPQPSVSELKRLPKQVQKQEGYFTCQNDFKAYPFQDLPCIKDINFRCAKPECKIQVKQYIGMK